MEQAAAFANGDDFSVNFLSSNAGIVQGRNQLATEFMDSGFDRLIFLDSDVTWELGSIVKLAHHPVDFVGGCYRLKRKEEQYPIAWIRGTAGQEFRGIDLGDNKALLEVEGVPTGFLSLSRKVFETMLEKRPRDLTTQCGHKCYAFFQMPVMDGHLYGEDFFFCREWQELDGKIYLDPELKLTHWDFNPTPHVGHIGNWLKNRSNQELKGNENV